MRQDYAAAKIVICWHHGEIPPLTSALGAPEGTYPEPWNPAVFDLVLILSYDGDIAVAQQAVMPF